MARLYADEDFPLPVVEALRRLGHDVRTVQDAGRAGLGILDAEVSKDAVADDRAVLTHNHRDFSRLHRRGVSHRGIISATHDPLDPEGLAKRIHEALGTVQSLATMFVRVTRPNRSRQSGDEES